MVWLYRLVLVLIFVVHALGLLYLYQERDMLQATNLKLSDIYVMALYFGAVLGLVAVPLLWLWRQAGLYILLFAHVYVLIIHVSYGAGWFQTLLGPVLLGLLVAAGWPFRNNLT